MQLARKEVLSSATIIVADAAAKPAMLANLEHASPQDANIVNFVIGAPVSKVVVIINRLLTSAFDAILKALQVCLQC